MSGSTQAARRPTSRWANAQDERSRRPVVASPCPRAWGSSQYLTIALPCSKSVSETDPTGATGFAIASSRRVPAIRSASHAATHSLPLARFSGVSSDTGRSADHSPRQPLPSGR